MDPDQISYNTAVSASQTFGRWELAVHTLDSMIDGNVSPDGITYSAAISSCEKGLKWQLAVFLLASMFEQKLPANEDHYPFKGLLRGFPFCNLRKH